MGNTPGVTKSVQEVHLDKQVSCLSFSSSMWLGVVAGRARWWLCVAGWPGPGPPAGIRLTADAYHPIHTHDQVTLLDSPGVVFADAGADGAAAAALRNAVKVEQLPDPVMPVAEIVRRCPAKQLMRLYKVAAFEGADQFLQLVAQVGG